MKLTGKVIKVESAEEFVDKIQRVHIRLSEADVMYQTFRVPNTERYLIDDQVTIEMDLVPYHNHESVQQAVTGEM